MFKSALHMGKLLMPVLFVLAVGCTETERIEAANEQMVTVFARDDGMAKALDLASKHCAKYNKKAQWAGQVGTGARFRFLVTYHCVP